MGWRDKIRNTVSKVATAVKAAVTPSKPAPTQTFNKNTPVQSLASGPNQVRTAGGGQMSQAPTPTKPQMMTPAPNISTNKGAGRADKAGNITLQGTGEVMPTKIQDANVTADRPLTQAKNLGEVGQTLKAQLQGFGTKTPLEDTSIETPFGTGGKAAQGLLQIAKKQGLKVGAASIYFKGGKLSGVTVKTEQIAESLITGKLSVKTLTVAAGTVAAAASSMFFGMWGQAEAAEPLTIAMGKIGTESKKTGDWTLYNEAAAARDEILQLDVWEKIAMWTPFSPAIGIPNKIEGAAKAAIIMDKWALDQQELQGNIENIIRAGEGTQSPATADTPAGTPVASKVPTRAQAEAQAETQYWKQRKQEETDQYKANTDYWVTAQKTIINFRNQARSDGDRQAAAFWAGEAEKQRALEEADRIAIMEFWLAYRKQVQKMQQDERPSKLNFGRIV